MIRSCLVAVLLMAAICPAVGFADTENAFQRRAEIMLSGSGYKAIQITPDIYSNSRTDLADIVIMSDDGTVIPYFIHDRAAIEEFSDSSFPMDFENRFISNNNLYLDFSLTSLPENQDILATSIRLSSRDQFVRDVSVLGSFDGLYWEPVTRYTIFNVSDSQRLEIPLSPAQRYIWYRFRIPFAEDPISIDSVELNYNSSVWRFSEFIEGLVVPFSVEENGNTTVVTLQGVRNLPLVSITLGTDSMFKRRVSAGHTQKELFNLMFEDASYQDLVLPMDGYASHSDELEIIIFNNDDAPIQLNSVEIEYRTAVLVFDAPQSGTAYVYYGNPGITSPPRYDIMNYMDMVLERGYEILSLGEPEELFNEPPLEEDRDYSLYYSIVLVATASVLVIIIVLRLKKVSK